ncbi:MAG: cytochrome c biogenesis protein CcsA [Bryobacteraceae bacterium]|nr:cytochrome c biogenesis protein CcsA [Bryobacteraceae bacterium]
MRDKIIFGAGIFAALYFIRNLYVILLQLPDEAMQGAVYRIFFFHLPPYFAAVFCFLGAAIASGMYLKTKRWHYDVFAVSATEVGLALAAINLVTGMIWGRQQWGIWWTWDARLTSALITWLIYLGYLMLREGIKDPSERAKNSAVLSIFAFFAVYFTYKANEWYRTQHPGPVLTIRTGKNTIDPAMQAMLFHNLFAFLLLTVVLVAVRMRLEDSQRAVESLRRRAHAVA